MGNIYHIEHKLLHNYFSALVNRFFKILPMRENAETTLRTYLIGLRDELLGCDSLLDAVDNDEHIMSLLGILQYLIDTQDASIKDVKSKVFYSISICNKLKAKYSEEGVAH